jgi:hypothetical protein
MAGVQKLMKQMKAGHWLMLIVVVVLVIAVYNYSNGKGMNRDGMSDGVAASLAQMGGAIVGTEQRMATGGSVEPSPAVEGQNSEFASAEGAKTSAHGMPPSAIQAEKLNARDLLPKDHNSEWSAGGVSAKDVLNVNFATPHERIGQSMNVLRNANQLLIRPEPAITKADVGPWLGSTIDQPDPRFVKGIN